MERKELHLQPRLQLLADLVPDGARLADIGTDHGYLPVWLLKHGRIQSAIAADIGAEPLHHARCTAREQGTGSIDFRLSDGLGGIAPSETDTVVIAGMGGETMIHILQSAPWTADGFHTLLLQPMTKTEDLRLWLSLNGYRYTGEFLVEDKDFIYPVLRLTGGKQEPLTKSQQYGGVLLDDDPLYAAYLQRQIDRLTRAADGRRHAADHSADMAAIRQLETILQELKEKKRRLCHDHRT